MPSLLLAIMLILIFISCIIPLILPNYILVWAYFFIISILSSWLLGQIINAAGGKAFIEIIIVGVIPYITLMSTIIRTIILLLNKPSKIEK